MRRDTQSPINAMKIMWKCLAILAAGAVMAQPAFAVKVQAKIWHAYPWRSLSVSSDGSKVIVLARVGGDFQSNAYLGDAETTLKLIDLRTSQVYDLHVGSNLDTAWSPNGRLLAYATNVWPCGVTPELAVMNAEGEPAILWRRTFDKDKELPATGPVWSPDGSKLAFVKAVENGAEMTMTPQDGYSPVSLTPAVADNTDGLTRAVGDITDSTPAWLSNETLLYEKAKYSVDDFLAGKGYIESNELWSVSLQGKSEAVETHLGAHKYAPLSPDRTKILATAFSCAGTALIIDLRTRSTTEVKLDPQYKCFVRAAWSPDSSKLMIATTLPENPSHGGVTLMWGGTGGTMLMLYDSSGRLLRRFFLRETAYLLGWKGTDEVLLMDGIGPRHQREASRVLGLDVHSGKRSVLWRYGVAL